MKTTSMPSSSAAVAKTASTAGWLSRVVGMASGAGLQVARDLGERGVGQRRAVGEDHSRHRLVTAIDPHDQVGSGRVVLDVDLGERHAGPLELPLQPGAVPAPCRAVDGQLRRHRDPFLLRYADLRYAAQANVWALSLSTGTGCVPFQSRGRCPASACKHARVTSPDSHVGPPVGAAEAVLAALDPEQRTASLAGAGTGKTRTITHRVAYGVLTGMVPASQVLAVTFTGRPGGELRGRLRALGVGGVP